MDEDMPEILKAFAERTRRSVKPDGGRQEGAATTLPEMLMMQLLTTPQRAFGAVNQYETEGTYNPAPIMEAALTAMTGAMPMAQAGALGSAGGRAVQAMPMDEASRMGRAAAQGYTIDAYKGMLPYHPDSFPTTNGFGKVLEPAKRPMEELRQINSSRPSDNPISNGAGFFSSDPAVASRFAEAFGIGSVYPVKLRFENPKIIDAHGRFAADFQFGPGAGQLKLPKDSPHDGVILKNTKDEGDVYIPNTPQQIRSRWAAFDPSKKDSGDLLASLAAILGAGGLLQGEHGQK